MIFEIYSNFLFVFRFEIKESLYTGQFSSSSF